MKLTIDTLREIVLSELEEYHTLDNAPPEFNVPDVNPSDSKYLEANEIRLGQTFLDTGYEGYEADKNTQTAEAYTLIGVDRAKRLPGYSNEDRRWELRRSGWWFGNFPMNEWQGFVEGVADRGLDFPITIKVEKNGDAYLYEGNHRLAAYDILGIKQIPADIRWYGNVQGTERDQLKDIFFREFGRKNYWWLKNQ